MTDFQFACKHISLFRSEVLCDLDTEELKPLFQDDWRGDIQFAVHLRERFNAFREAIEADEEIDRLEGMAEERIGGRNE